MKATINQTEPTIVVGFFYGLHEFWKRYFGCYNEDEHRLRLVTGGVFVRISYRNPSFGNEGSDQDV